jgi:hypothetical protein
MRTLLILSIAFLLSACDAPAAADQAGANHRVRPGESLFAIAERAYGNGLEWPRIWDANPWLDPDHLRAGEILFVPPRDSSWGDPPSKQRYSLDPGTGSFEEASESPPPEGGERRAADPGNGGAPGLQVFRNLANNVASKTVLGVRIEKGALLLFLCFFLHATIQGILVWLAANITFVKEATLKKSIKAVFLTESLTLSTVVILGLVGILLLYLGKEPPGAQGGGTTELFPALEGTMRSTTGVTIAGAVIFLLYIILSLRFLPQVFQVPIGRAIPLMALAILVPHLIGVYLVGQRMGLIH